MASKSDFTPFWPPFGSLCDPLGVSLGASWASSGAVCDPLGALGGHQVALWVSLLMLWRYLGISWGHFGGSSQLWAGDPQVKTISFACFAWMLIFFVRRWAWHLELETCSLRLRSSAWDLELESLSPGTVAWYRTLELDPLSSSPLAWASSTLGLRLVTVSLRLEPLAWDLQLRTVYVGVCSLVLMHSTQHSYC